MKAKKAIARFASKSYRVTRGDKRQEYFPAGVKLWSFRQKLMFQSHQAGSWGTLLNVVLSLPKIQSAFDKITKGIKKNLKRQK